MEKKKQENAKGRKNKRERKRERAREEEVGVKARKGGEKQKEGGVRWGDQK